MQKLVRLIITCLLIVIAIRCAPLRDSPYSSRLLRDERDLNNLNIAALSDIDADTKITAICEIQLPTLTVHPASILWLT